MNINELYPQQIWRYFLDICSIPHPSGYEKKLADYIIKFAQNNDLFYQVDEFGNVAITKEAANNKKNCQTTILQAHLDMVPQKDIDKKFNFKIDPIEPIIENGFVIANKTTLGADNGIGVATILAILADKKLNHGPIKAVFTLEEEIGLKGASKLNPDFMKGDILLNLDSEDDNQLFIGCAGGVRTDAIFHITENEQTGNTKNDALKITLDGLNGGHSGCDIHLNHLNAIKSLASILWSLYTHFDITLSDIEGGTVDNAIPRHASAVICFDRKESQQITELITILSKELKKQHSNVEKNIDIAIKQVSIPQKAFSKKFTKIILSSLNICPNAVISWHPEINNLVETSSNLAIINIENNQLIIKTAQRSSNNKQLIEISRLIGTIFELTGAEVIHRDSYPGWHPNINSKILQLAKECHKDVLGTEPEIRAIHAGLECGILSSYNEKLDIISFGPEILYPHSPNEKVKIESVEKFWDYLCELLTRIASK